MSIGLIGYRGSGKTTVGRRLADRLWQPFVDTDERIVAAAGCSIKEIFEQQGEPAFRDLETQVIRDVAQQPDTVIAFGGGALDREQNRAALKSSGLKLIYLKCESAALLERIRSDPQTAANRPNLTAMMGGIDEIQAVLARREPIWRAAMTAELDVTNLSPEEAVVYVARLV